MLCPWVINFQSARSQTQMISFHPVSTVIRFAICGVFPSPIRSCRPRSHGVKTERCQKDANHNWPRAFLFSASRCQFSSVNWKYEGDQSGRLRVKNVLRRHAASLSLNFYTTPTHSLGEKWGFWLRGFVDTRAGAVLINLLYGCSSALCFYSEAFETNLFSFFAFRYENFAPYWLSFGRSVQQRIKYHGINQYSHFIKCSIFSQLSNY